ncbi:hypothetical protein N5J44_15010 [Acinetobacter ursingii]|uniref:hypothetical protein n=1 Tax=Acinetobacter ursingii TaxID=108980 RepID=UPI00244839F8|nr:hypothetical protein [Acinetobacter ursingii]MDH2020525.1 hypothetical protein [Acinetobacter ursingii]MDH2072833.1 hypothetical protein [Acinetobacter ursingii]
MKKANVHIFILKFVIGLFFFSFFMTYVHSNAEITNLSMLFYGFKLGLWFATIATTLICVLLGLARFINNKPEKNELIYSWFYTSTKYTLAFVCTLAFVIFVA